MALMKRNPLPATVTEESTETDTNFTRVYQHNKMEEEHPPFSMEGEDEPPCRVDDGPITTEIVVKESQEISSIAAAAKNGIKQAQEEGLEFDWTSFPTITLKTEGIFQDIDNRNYGTEFSGRILDHKKRYVYRASKIINGKSETDPRRDVVFSFDKVVTQNGILVADKITQWQAEGKTVEEKEYLQVMLEMIAPNTPYNGEFRILSIAPQSKGRFAGHYAKCLALYGNAYKAVTRIYVGEKIMKVANPFYPWMFEVVQG